MLKKELNTVKIGGLSLISTSQKRLLEFLASRILQGKKTFIVTPNPEFLVFARHNSWFKRVLNKADIAIPDGIGLILAGRVLRQPIKERISGTDLMKKLCAEAAKRSWSVYLLGGKQGVAKKTLAVLKRRYSRLKGWAASGPKLETRNSELIGNARFAGFLRNGKLETGDLIKRINSKRPDLLFVAFGMGKQEKFIWDNWDKLNVKLAIGVGGAFDYISGLTPRAPKWVQKAGFEWLYRLIKEPWRLRRQLKLLEFTFLIFQEKLRKS